MPKESFVLRLCDFVTKYSIYALIFLVPIFFLPWTSDILDFNKQVLLITLVFISLFGLMIKILVSGRFEINKSPMNIVMGGLFVVYVLATVFSIYRYGSFWGQPQQISESLLTVLGLLLLYFLVSNVFSRKNIYTSLIVLSFSVVVAQLIGVLQLFGLFILPFSFAKSATFNMVGSVGSLGFLSAILLPLAIVLLITAKKWWKVLFAVQIALSALIIFLINYPMIWWVVIVCSALVLVLAVMKRDIFDGRWMALPMFFLAVSLFFVLLNVQIGWLPKNVNEVFLSQKTGFNIAMQSVKERPIFGSGPGTYAYDFSKFKDAGFSNSSLWNITFNKSSSKVLNSLTTTGILGFLAMIALMLFPIYYAIKSFILKGNNGDNDNSEKSNGPNKSVLLFGLSIVIVGQTIVYFIYNSNIVLDFIYFLSIALLTGLIFENKKRYVLKPSSLITLISTFVFTLVFIFGLGILILNGQRYIAEVNYSQGLVDYQKNQKTDGLGKLEAAVTLNPKYDLYFRQLSQAYLIGLQESLQNLKTTATDQEKTVIQTLLSNSINAGKIATDLNPKDVNNWASRGYVYQNIIGVSADAQTWAINSYEEAIKLDPNNPYLYLQEGNVYLSVALNSIGDQKKPLFEKAQTQLEKAVRLNPNYSDALYSLGIVYDSLGQSTKSIETFTRLLQLNPTNTEIAKILTNLKAGLSASQVATPPKSNPPDEANGQVKNPPAQ